MFQLKAKVDIEIRFGMRNLIEKRDEKVYCFLCFVEFDTDHCDDHINSDFHQTLMKVTERLKDEDSVTEEDLCSSDISAVKENNQNLGDDQIKFYNNDNIKNKSEISNRQCNHFEIVNPSTSTVNKNIDPKDYTEQNGIRYNKERHETMVKETEKLEYDNSVTEEDLCSSDTSAEKENNLKVEDENIKICNDDNIGVKSEISRSQSKDSKMVKPSTSKANKNIDLKDYTTQNNIRYKKENKQALCVLCNVYILNNIQSMTEHVNGGTHQKIKVSKNRGLSKKKTVKQAVLYKTVAWQDFMKTIKKIENPFAIIGFLINKKIFIGAKNFMLLKKINPLLLKCYACEGIFFEPDTEFHIRICSHREYSKTPIVDLENEFIREIKPKKLFQCGHCNEFCSSWSLMQKHLNTMQHYESRQKSEEMVKELARNREQEHTLKEMLGEMFFRSF